MGRITDERARWIVSNAQRSVNNNSNEFERVRLEELVQADEWCGHHDVHSGYRLLIKNRIYDLRRERDSENHRRETRKSTAIGFVLSLVVALVAVGADRYFSSI